MKKALFIIFAFLPLILFGQEGKCCQTKQQVEKFLSGFWQIRDADSDRQYRFWFKDGQGNLEYIVPAENDVVATIRDDNHSFIDVLKLDDAFILKITDPYGQQKAVLKHLDHKKMILSFEGKEVEYQKLVD